MTDPFTKMFQQMLSQGQEMARTFNPALEHFDVKAFEKMFPTMPADMLEMWFGKTFNRDGLDARTRLLVTIAAMTVQGTATAGDIALEIALRITAIGPSHDPMGEIELTGSANVGTVHIPLPGMGTVEDFSFDVDARLRTAGA